MTSPRLRRAHRSAYLAGVLVVLTAAAAFFLPVPFVTLEPGPTFDVLADSGTEPIVQINGAPTYPTTGRLDMTTVSQSGGSTPLPMGSALAAWILPNRSVEPRDVRFPPGSDADQERQINEAVFRASSSSALAATANYLGRPVASEVLVSSVEPDSPAAGSLESGDLITEIAGQPVSTAVEVGEAVRNQPVGSTIRVDFIRAGDPSSVEIVGAARPDGEPGAYLGVLLVDNYTSDFTANVTLEGVGGPSAGMVFSLAMVDKMTPEDLLDGAHVAGSGTIDGQGSVGPIGGLEKKLVAAQRAGAELFIAPVGNCPDIVDRIPAGLTVAAVSSLSEAIDSLSAWRAGETDLPTCQ